MKDTKQIAETCGLDPTRADLLERIMNSPDDNETRIGVVESIIGALYRRIEKLEEEVLPRYEWIAGQMGEVAERIEKIRGTSFGDIDELIAKEKEGA